MKSLFGTRSRTHIDQIEVVSEKPIDENESEPSDDHQIPSDIPENSQSGIVLYNTTFYTDLLVTDQNLVTRLNNSNNNFVKKRTIPVRKKNLRKEVISTPLLEDSEPVLLLDKNKSVSLQDLTDLDDTKSYGILKKSVSLEILNESSENVIELQHFDNLVDNYNTIEETSLCEIEEDQNEEKPTTNLIKNQWQSTPELLKSFNQASHEKYEPPVQKKFPTDDTDEDVVLRPNSIRDYRKFRSKTEDFNTEKHTVDFRGVQGVQHDRKWEIFNDYDVLRFDNGHFFKFDQSRQKKTICVYNVKSITQSSRKECVEVRDIKNNVYTITFKKQQDAKLFTTHEKIQKYLTESKISVGIRLRWLLGRRSSREVLEDKGIYKNEAIFGNTLKYLYEKNNYEVPKFIQRVVQLIEKPENIKSLGIYRTSGNLATIQKIRLEVDNGKLAILDQYEKDVDVLTGCLKMFFRELKEPLITCETCENILEMIKTSKSDEIPLKLRQILTSELHEGNLETLFLIIRHLINVVKHKDLSKMDSYNLAVCWGPSAIFSVYFDATKDIVAQSHDATRLLDYLINFYTENPEEIEVFSQKKSPNFDRQLSNETFKSSSSSISYMVDDIIRKITEIIEKDIRSEGLYKKSGSLEKAVKIYKKMNKKKYNELEKCKGDVHDFTEAFKKFLTKDFPNVVSNECVEKILNYCDDISICLENVHRHKIIKLVEDFPKKDTFIYIIKHIIKVIDYENHNKVSKNDLIDIWTKVLNYQEKICDNKIFTAFLNILILVFDENKPDMVKQRHPVNVNMQNVIKDMEKINQEKDRYSKYDNVPENSKNEANFLDDDNNNFKTEQITKL